jgi:hypothetical protein
MIIFKNFRAVSLAAALLLSAAASQIHAQPATYRGTPRGVRQLILRIENHTDAFRSSLRNNINTARAENLDSLAQDLDAAVRQLRHGTDRSIADAGNGSADAQEVLNRAALIDRVMNRRNVRNSAVIRRWADLRADFHQLATFYNLSWSPAAVGETYPNNSAIRLTGTYRLDPSRSDDPAQAADRATQSIPYGNRGGLRDRLVARLASPDQIAIDVRGRDVTLASSRAPQISFTADGLERVETTNSGRTIRARATLNGQQLTVNSTGDRESEFNVTFEPVDYGRRLRVTRRVTVPGLSNSVVVQSTYDKTDQVAHFDINSGPQTYPDTSGNDFLLANGETVVAVLDTELSSATARNGDRFTATVRQPSQYEGARIEGHVSDVARSGRISGRSQMTVNFDSIRLRDGRSYQFAGLLESVRTSVGDTVSVDNEGAVRDDNQTTKTVERAAIGTAVGALIGAIAGGGKGAAIGAIVGAGGGAGSVYVEGRDDLNLSRGTELTIRATSPR